MAKYELHPITFYSNLANWLFNHSSSKMPAAQWLGTLKALKNTSQDEIEALGLTDLDGLEPTIRVQKCDLCSLVEQHLDDLKLELLTLKLSRFRPEFRVVRFEKELLPKKVRKLLNDVEIIDCFRFASFNYRIIRYKFDGGVFGSFETCIVFDSHWEQLRPKRGYSMLEAVDMAYIAITQRLKKYVSTGDETKFERFSTLGDGSRYQEWLLRLPSWSKGFSFEGGHFDLNNVLLHLRTTHWRDEQGCDLLLVDEVQSDWHARGRDYGYYRNGEIYENDHVPWVPFAKEWALLGVRVAIAIAVQKGFNRLAFVSSKVQAERYGNELDGFVQLYDQQIPDYLNKLAKQFECGFTQTSIMVSKPRHYVRYSAQRMWEVQSRERNENSHFVYNYPVALFYLKNTGNEVKRELKVFEISPDLRESIKQFGLPIFGNFKVA
jgi:hypothetical protein